MSLVAALLAGVGAATGQGKPALDPHPPAVGKEAGTTDIVFAVDLSASMTTKESDGETRFQKVRSRLVEFIRNEVDLGANIAVVTFGERMGLVAKERIKTDADKTKLIRQIEMMKADAQATYMAGGIDIALQALQGLTKEHPNRSRILVLLTDGKNQPPRSVPPEKQITYQKLLKRYKSLPGFKPGSDWFFWYCFIGKPDEETRKFVEAMAGEPKPVTGPWRFLKVRFNRVVLNLGEVPTGTWTVELPSAADRRLGESLQATTRAPGKYVLQLSDVLLAAAAKGERVTVSPRRIPMGKAEQAVVLTLTGTNIAAGEHRGRIVMRSPGKMVFVRPQQFHVRFRASSPEVSIAPRDGIRFGRLTPGKTEVRTFEVIPNEMARKLAADRTVKLMLPKDVPVGVALTAEPASVSLAKAASVRLKVAVSADASLPAEGYKGVVGFSATGVKGLVFKPATLGVSFESTRPEIDVAPGRVDFGIVMPGASVIREVSLRPNEAARAVAATVTLAAEGPLPKGMALKIEPKEVAPRAQTNVRLTLSLSADASVTKVPRGAITLKIARKAATLSRQRVTWQATAAEAGADVTPGDRIDFGSIEPTKKQTRSVWLTPNPAAAKLKSTVRLLAEGVPEGTSVTFDPPKVTLDRKQEIKVTVTAGPRPGRHTFKLQLTCDRPTVRLGAAELAAVYSAESSVVTIDAKELLFERAVGDEGAVSIRVRVVATQGAIGQTVRLAWKFGDLPEGMVITPSPRQITLSQPAETVPLTLAIRGEAPGRFDGCITFSADVGVRPKELPVRLDVTARQIELLNPPKPWSLRLSPWGGAEEAELPMVLKANSAADGVSVSFKPEEDLPEGITITAEPQKLKLTTGENTVKLRAKASVPPSLFGRTYTGKLKVVTDSPKAAVHPDRVEWEVVVPALWPYAACAGGAVLVLLALFCWLCCPRRLMSRLSIQSMPSGGSVTMEEVPYEAGEEIVLESRCVKIGPGELCTIVLAARGTEAESPGQWTLRLGRRRRAYLKRSRNATQSVSVEGAMDGNESRSVEIGQRIPLEHGDTIRIDRFVFLFEET